MCGPSVRQAPFRQFDLSVTRPSHPHPALLDSPLHPAPETMFAQRFLTRSTQRMAFGRTPPRAGRRNYSSEAPQEFVGAENNEFNRERARIAAHGAESGELWRKLSI